MDCVRDNRGFGWNGDKHIPAADGGGGSEAATALTGLDLDLVKANTICGAPRSQGIQLLAFESVFGFVAM